MRYSNEILTDENFEYEVEKLSDLIGIPYRKFTFLVDKLDPIFKLRIHSLGFEEWFKSNLEVSIEGPSTFLYEQKYLAYEFGNGFIIINFDKLVK